MSPQRRLLVLGGNGYVGSQICDAAVACGKFAVSSLSRSGKPKHPNPHLTNLSAVEWLEGDVLDGGCRDATFKGSDVVISAIGAFGSNEFMERVCGDATIGAVESAASNGATSFGFVSSAQVGRLDLSPSTPMYGYFNGKARAEGAIKSAFPNSHAILRPGFIYGPRMVGSVGPVPLQLVGAPVNFVGTQMGPISSIIQSIPFVGTECSSMVPVEAVARAAVESLSGDEDVVGGRILMPEDIRKFS